MANNSKKSDSASSAPRFIPDADLLPRDDSGGPDFKSKNKSGQFGDGGKLIAGKSGVGG